MKILFVLWLFAMSCCVTASQVTLTFDDIPSGSYPANCQGVSFDGTFKVLNHSQSNWGPPHSAPNVLVSDDSAGEGPATIEFPLAVQPTGCVLRTISSFGAYFSTEPGTVLALVGHRTNGEVVTTFVGADTECYGVPCANQWAEVRSDAGDIERVTLEPFGCGALRHYCADDVTIDFPDGDPPSGFGDGYSQLSDIGTSTAAWADYDNDGDLDLLLYGRLWTDAPSCCTLYRNDNGSFIDSGLQLPQLAQAAAAWGDYDNDGDLDLVIADFAIMGGGYNTGVRIYRNNGGVLTDSGICLPGSCAHVLSWVDLDNDGDLDLQVGEKLYRNDGGVFRDLDVSLPIGDHGAVAWGDYDNDGDLDLLIADYESKIYRNDGGTLTDSGVWLPGMGFCSVAWGDYDNDGDLDLALAGMVNWGAPDGYPLCAIYRNDGGTFTDIGAQLPGVWNCSLAWGDYDNDGDLDLAVCGGNADLAGSPATTVYRNDGGTFVDSGLVLPGVAYGALAWGDCDGDGDLDLLLSGNKTNDGWYYGTGPGFARIYRNGIASVNAPPSSPTGLQSTFTTGGLTLTWNAAADDHTPAAGLSYNVRIGTTPGGCDIISGDAGATGFRKVALTGNAQKMLSCTIRELKSSGTYYWSVQAIDTAFAGSAWAEEQQAQVSLVKIKGHLRNGSGQGIPGVILHAGDGGGITETDSDGYYELAVPSGWSGPVAVSKPVHWFTPTGRSYRELTADIVDQDYLVGTFTDIGASLIGVTDPAIAWGDYDGDGDLDLLVTGCTGFTTRWNYATKLYRNDGGNFVDSGVALPGVAGASAAWGDYDNDGDLDLALAGGSQTGQIDKIFRNDGGVFTDIGAPLSAVSNCSVAWGDYDNDGDLDLAVSGVYSWNGYVSVFKVYRNDKGVFADSGMSLPQAYSPSIAWADYDNDGDLDLSAIACRINSSSFSWFGAIYRNDSGVLGSPEVSLPGLSTPATAWGDYDNDGDLDLVLGGWNDWTGRVGGIYANNHGVFTDIGAPILLAANPQYAWGDFDNDGDLDLAIAGTNILGDPRILRNDAGNFVDAGVRLPGAWNLAWGDYDADGDLDLAITTPSGSRIYRNDGGIFNTPPSAPTGLSASVDSKGVTMRWNASADAETPTPGLSYDVRVGRTPGGCDVMSSASDRTTGRLFLPQIGNVGESVSWTLKNLSTGVYYWSVQSVDTSFAGSAWSAPQAFAVGNVKVSPSLAKHLQDHASVSINAAVVSAAFADAFYLESDDRSAGIRVEMPSHGLSAGMRAGVSGYVGTNADGEARIVADTAVQTGIGGVMPLATNGISLGGGALGLQGAVSSWQWVTDQNDRASLVWLPAQGLNNIGLLVTTWGRITQTDPSGVYFYLDDGSVVSDSTETDGVGNTGIRVLGSTGGFAAGDFVVVTGVSSCTRNSAGEVVRLVRATEVRKINTAR